MNLTTKEFELFKEFPKQNNLSLLPKLIPITFSISKIDNENISKRTSEAFDTKLTAQLQSYKVLNKDPSRPVYYFDFDVINNNKEEFKFEPGDSFGFFPELSREEVENLAEILQVNLDELVKICGSKEMIASLLPNHSFDNELIVTIKDILCRIDLGSFPKKAVLRTLAEYCSDENEANLLLFLSSRNGSEVYNRLRGDLLSGQLILNRMESLKNVPIEVLVSLFGSIQPRYYSCCRKQQNEFSRENSFQIVFNVSEYSSQSTPDLKLKGLCSSWLENLMKPSESKKILSIQKRSINHFRLPVDLSLRPIIMIACGTGIAPFIGFLEILDSFKSEIPFNWLIFGLRSIKNDFIFEEEVNSFLQNGTLSKLSLAPSRDPDHPKVYVQDILKKEKAEFFKLITEKDALIYICGDELTMIKGVNDAILEIILENQSELNQKEAENLLIKWTKEKKIIRDIWV